MDTSSLKEKYDKDNYVAYIDILLVIGENVITVQEDNYQGDTWSILKSPDGKLGFIQFGWGSCSGCDALQACENFEEVKNLAVSMSKSVTWFDSESELITYFQDHDWKGEYCWHCPDFHEFLDDVNLKFPFRKVGV